MAINLMDMFNNTVGELVTNNASEILGESTESTQSAILSFLPTVTGALIKKTDSDQGVQSMLDYLTAHKIDGTSLSKAASLTNAQDLSDLLNEGTGFLDFVMKDKISIVVDHVAASSNLKTSSSNTLLKLVASLLAGVVAKYITDKNMDKAGIKSLLQSQRDAVRLFLPEALNGILGFDMTPPTKDGNISGSDSSSADSNQTLLSILLPWLVLLLTTLGLFYFVQRGCGSEPGINQMPHEMTQDTIK